MFLSVILLLLCKCFLKKRELMALSNNAMTVKVLARKVLGFKSVILTPFTFPGTNLVTPWIILFTLFKKKIKNCCVVD
jgi:hypothetical protein